MKRRAFPVILFILAIFPLSPGRAQEIAVSASVWSFFAGSGGWRPVEPGAFASAGVMAGITPRLEAGASLIARMTPEPANDLIVEIHAGYSIFAERFRGSDLPASHLNAILDAGFMIGAHSLYSGGPATVSPAAFVRLTPVAIGNAFSGKRDRLFTFGLLYDFGAKRPALFMNLVSSDFFLACGRNIH